MDFIDMHLTSNNREDKLEALSRYIVHVEDQPSLFSKRFHAIGEAMQSAHDHVLLALHGNGCGGGLVYDFWKHKVVAVFAHDQTLSEAIGNLAVSVEPVLEADKRPKMLEILAEHYPMDCPDGGTDCDRFIWRTWFG